MISSLFSSRWFRISAVILVILLGILIGLPYLIKQQARSWLDANGGERVEIRGTDGMAPIAAGDQVAVAGVGALSDGARVEIDPN